MRTHRPARARPGASASDFARGAALVLGLFAAGMAQAGMAVVCTASMDIQNQWQGGFQGQVTLKNTSAAALPSWRMEFDFANSAQISNAWNAQTSQAGSHVVATNPPWAASLPAGASTSFGFVANGDAAGRPSFFTLNGRPCNLPVDTGGDSGGGTGGDTGGGDSGNGDGACAGQPLCEGFEADAAGGAPNASRWTIDTPNCGGTGSATVDGSVAHSGSKSIRVNGQGGYCNHVFIANRSVVGSLGQTIYGRFFMRLSAPLGDNHTTFMAMKDAADGNRDLRMGGQNRVLMWNRESDDATLPSMSPAGTSQSVVLPQASWQCVEFMLNGLSGELRTWVNGALVNGLVVDTAATQDIDQAWLARANWRPRVTDFKLGWESYAGQALTLWFDDIALGKARIGCN